MWWDSKKLGREVETQKERFGNLPADLKEERFREEAEAGWARIEACAVQFKAGENILSGGRFDTCSLGTWMEIVKPADLTCVPAEMVALASGSEIMRTRFAPIELSIPEALLGYRGMVRMDSCGSQSLKMQFGVRGSHEPEGGVVGAQQKDGKWFFVFDDRTIHGFLGYVGQIQGNEDIQHPIWWRPWVSALPASVARPKFMGRSSGDVWLLEWRVIVQNGKVAAISAYYIQALVTMSAEIAANLKDILRQSNTLLSFMREHGIQPWHPCYMGERAEDDISFSFDFISTPNGPAFLEAGPAVPVNEQNIPVEIWGAHPCNFLGRKIGGIALNKTDTIPLETI